MSSHHLRPSDSGLASHRAGIWPLVTASEMQALDRRTIRDWGLPGDLLMESAGRGLMASALALRRDSERPRSAIRVLCGVGNNGGDGLVLVRHLHAEQIPVEALLVGEPERLPVDAKRNWERLEKVGAAFRVVDCSSAGAAAPEFDWASIFERSSVVVDALFGTGLGRPIQGRLADLVGAVARARERGLRVLSVDLPSGICADTGQVLGAAIVADRTLTISLPKPGLAIEPGRSHAGEVRVMRVGIADPSPDRPRRIELWNARAAAARFPARPRAGHKGSFGHVLVVAGSPGKLGAGALCSRAAVRAGAGLVTVAYPKGLDAELDGIPVEAMTQSVASTIEGGFAPDAESMLVELAHDRDVVALGPGLGRGSGLREWLPSFVQSIERPLVIDADGLNAFVDQLDTLRLRTAPTVLTPHPGEAGALLGCTVAELSRDRIGAARELARRSGSIAVLKGAGTVIAEAAGRSLLIPTGGPALATGGTGDVLTGVIAALLASGLDAFDAAGLGAWWHGATADRLIGDRAAFGLMASELADALPDCATMLLRGLNDLATREGEGEDLALRFPGP